MKKKKDWFAISMIFVCLSAVIVPVIYFLGVFFSFIRGDMDIVWLVSFIVLIIFIVSSAIIKRWELFKYGLIAFVVFLLLGLFLPAFALANPII